MARELPDGYDRARCWAMSRSSGQQCKFRPLPGLNVCRYHGGAAPQVRAAGRRNVQLAQAKAAVVTYGLPIDIDPGQALLDEVHRTAGHVAWLAEVVGNLEADSLTWGLTATVKRPVKLAGGADDPADMVEETTYTAAINVWMALYAQERRHLVVVAKAALDAGIDERRVRVAEELGGEIVRLFQRVLGELHLSPEQQALAAIVVPRALAATAETAVR